jgi:hypothetical protein
MPDFISETKQMFAGQNVMYRDPQVKQMIEKNRINNFEFRDPGVNFDPTLNTSVAHTDFNFKGNAMEIRQVLNPEVKKDLRQHHFEYGNYPVEYTRTNAMRASASYSNGFVKPPVAPPQVHHKLDT